MDLLQIFSLGVLQGLTEFLPVSSSAHLILVPKILGWQDQGLAFDVAVHVGTLMAVVYYFRLEIKQLFSDCYQAHCLRQPSVSTNLALCIIIGTFPAVIAGLILSDVIELHLRSVAIIAGANIGFGLILWWSDQRKHPQKSEYGLNYRQALLIGFAQALALIPGASRSGTTITAALLLGLSRQAAARFSFLLSIPIIFGAGSLQTMKLLAQTGSVDWFALILGTLVSGISAYFCIHYFLKLLDRIGMFPFVVYRLILGVFLLVLFCT